MRVGDRRQPTPNPSGGGEDRRQPTPNPSGGGEKWEFGGDRS
ncbi:MULTISPECIES: hypothetical protein [unclassified Okeania]|nr:MULTISPECIES: hypothetical protein [unclassified Okeania]